MRAVRLGLGLVLGGFVMGGLTGCEPSNENATKLDSVPATGANGGPPPTSQKQYYEASQKAQGQNPYGQGYPGGSGSPAR